LINSVSLKLIKPYLALIFIVLLFTRGFPVISSIYYLVYPIILFFVIDFFISLKHFQKKYLKNYPNNEKSSSSLQFIIILSVLSFIVFGIWSLVTTFWSNDKLVTINRSIFFLALLLSSINMGRYLSTLHFTDFTRLFLIINITIVAVSLITLIFNYPDLPLKGSKYYGFMGFANHPNKLGQYLFISFAFTSIFFINKILTSNSKKWFYTLSFVIIALLNFFILYKSFSRASILALFLFIFFFSILSIDKKRIFKFGFPLLLLLITLFYSSSTFKSELMLFLYKHDQENFISSRELLIKQSYQAAFDGGLFGIGYGLSSDKFVAPELGDFRSDTYFQREKTVSLFALVEETGFIGAFFFLSGLMSFIIALLMQLKQISDQLKKQFITFNLSFIIALNAYAQIESWWIGLGSLPLPLFFILIGLSLQEVLFPNVLKRETIKTTGIPTSI